MLFRIFHLHKIICNKANRFFSNEGMQIQVEQIPVLMVIHHLGPCSQQDIAHELLRDKSSVLRTVSSLQSAGFLKVENDSEDKRKKLVKLSAQGFWLTEKITAEVGEMDDRMFSNLSVAEKLILTELLDKCANNIEETEAINS